MANEQNLKPVRNKNEARERGKKGGQNSGKARRDKKILKDCFELLLEEKTNLNGKKLTGAEAMALTLFEKALGGDVKAAEFVRDTAGQKPIDKIMVAEIEKSVIDEVEAMVMHDYEE